MSQAESRLAADGADIGDVGGESARPWCVRVHDVRGSLDAVRVAAAWNVPSGDEQPGREKGGDHAIYGAVPGGVPAP